MTALPWLEDDGGRALAGFTGTTGDCVTRAIAIAAALPYRDVYDALAAGQAARGKPRSARDGVDPKVYKPYLERLGAVWTPTMQIGQGCTVHLATDELPSGRLIVRLSKHICAVIDGVVHDTYDPSRDGTRCVYGVWQFWSETDERRAKGLRETRHRDLDPSERDELAVLRRREIHESIRRRRNMARA